MWLPKPLYERIPMFYFLVGLLFIANGLYLGFEFEIAFFYIGFGLINCSIGVAMFLVRTAYRQAQPAVHAAISTGDMAAPAQDTPGTADESATESSQ